MRIACWTGRASLRRRWRHPTQRAASSSINSDLRSTLIRMRRPWMWTCPWHGQMGGPREAHRCALQVPRQLRVVLPWRWAPTGHHLLRSISASPTGQRLRRALALPATMQTARLSPHVITYSAPMSPCPKCQRLHQALAPLVTVQTDRSLPLSPPTPLPSVLARGPGIGTRHSAFWP